MGGGNAQKSAAARKYALVLFCDVFGYNFVQFITRSNVTLANVLTEVMYTGLKNMKDVGKTPEQR